jgi:electron transfer flavoprotein alpha subunit
LVLAGHTSYAYDLAPSLATELEAPLLTDCIDLAFEGSRLVGTRQIYGGKLNARVTCTESSLYMATLRQGSFQPPPETSGQIEKINTTIDEEPEYRRFLEYIEEAIGDVDITKADVVIGVGRGIKEEQNMSVVQQLADALGGVLACSRPVVDAGWLSKDRQVGSSGKTVKPKLYLAVGISGAFQHVTGMKGSDTIVAINKDPNAPIFADADYGIVDDLFKVIPSLTQKITEMRSGGKT